MINRSILPKFLNMLNLFDSSIFSKSNLFTSPPDLLSFQKVFNEALDSHLKKKMLFFKEITDIPIIISTIEHSLSIVSGGGKRIRPYMCFLAYCTENGVSQNEALRISVGLELFHAFALIHDDIIDRGKERHGKKTVHEYVKGLIDQTPHGDATHIAEGMAMLAGDLLFSWSQEIIISSNNKLAKDIFSKMIEEVVVGQMLDVSLMFQSKTTTEVLSRKNELKTALYSFVNPMLIGSALAGKAERTEFYRNFGLLIGQAFQIQDDLLDIVRSRKELGKIPFIDIQDGQHTLISQYVFDHGKPQDKEVLSALFGREIDDNGRKVLSRLFESTGAIQHAETEISLLMQKSKNLLISSDIKKEDKEIWMSIVSIINGRTS